MVQHREFSLVLCDSQEGWRGRVDGRKAQEGGNICINSVQFTQSCPTLRPHGLQHGKLPCPSPTPRASQTRVHQVSDAMQPFHRLSSPSPPAFNLSQHQGLCQWVSSLHQVAKVLEFQLQYQSFQWKFRTDFLMEIRWTDWVSLQSKGLSRVFSNTTV